MWKWIFNQKGFAFAVTTDFTSNTVISSSAMNTNFSDIETAINSIEDYIGAGVITNAMLAGLIDLTSKVTGALPGANIADEAIDSDHYVDGSIDNEHLADGVVDTEEIAADAIDGTKIADDAVDSEHIAAGAIDTEHIGNDQVTENHLYGYAESFAANGYVKLTGGLILQWGLSTTEGNHTVTFPTAFSNACLSVVATRRTTGTTTTNALVSSLSTASFALYSPDTLGVHWIAIGY